MNNIKTVFSIKDLEHFSGIKAHTIRMWEKRYNILEPIRTDTNIRMYDLASLQKLLNITLLNEFGYKISKISKYPEEKIPSLVQGIITEKSAKNHAISSFKLAMINFDQNLFLKTYDQLLSEKSFREIFYEIIIPLMNEIGLLWQNNSISPAHEHFITYLFKQKLLIATEKAQALTEIKHDRVFVLYLPENEIHELGLMYLNYEVVSNGYKSIFLGESVPIDSIKDLKRYFDKITYIAYTTVMPNKDEINHYVKRIENEIIDSSTNVWFIGRMVEHIQKQGLSDQINFYNSISELTDEL